VLFKTADFKTADFKTADFKTADFKYGDSEFGLDPYAAFGDKAPGKAEYEDRGNATFTKRGSVPQRCKTPYLRAGTGKGP
jgi:hypothetical protein